MTDAPNSPHIDRSDTSAFTIWLGRTLRQHHESVVHEPLPVDLLMMLPPADKD